MSIRIAITVGDYNGIGPEVILKSLQHFDIQHITPIILGSNKIIDHYLPLAGTQIEYQQTDSIDKIKDGIINVCNCFDDDTIEIKPGKLSAKAGKSAMIAVENGIQFCKAGQADALVTAPISKEAVNLAGYPIPGHTEFLAEKTNTGDFIMMMVNDQLRVGLISTHIPLRDVVSTISTGQIIRYIKIMNTSLTNDFGIGKPKIAVLGLNPHAGDGGMIGDEEIKMITPAIRESRAGGMNVNGPFPADGFFGNRTDKNFDGILAMYHDQGLIPFKTLSFGSGVNFTAGLPIIRTSPDHGTAFDIAGQGKASPDSFRQAFNLAYELAVKRKKD